MSTWTAPTQNEILADLDAIRAKVLAVEPTPEINPLQALLDQALQQRDGALVNLQQMTAERDELAQSLSRSLADLNSALDQRNALQALVNAGLQAAVATVQALTPVEA